MKSMHCFYRRGHFDDQYSLELEGFMTRQEFAATMNSFNVAAQRHPPPPTFSSGHVALFMLCTGTSILTAIVLAIHYTHHIALLLAIPFSFLVLSGIIVGWRRRMKNKFESSILELCACMNATENVRGINFRLTKSSPEQLGVSQDASPASRVNSYAITIEFDERYNLLHHFAARKEGMPPDYTFAASHPVPSPLQPYRLSLTDPPAYFVDSRPTQTGVQLPATTYRPDEKV